VLSPVVEFELVTEILDALVVGLVAGDKGKAMLEGDGRDDGIGPNLGEDVRVEECLIQRAASRDQFRERS
jgi:hypothetical protein